MVGAAHQLHLTRSPSWLTPPLHRAPCGQNSPRWPGAGEGQGREGRGASGHLQTPPARRAPPPPPSLASWRPRKPGSGVGKEIQPPRWPQVWESVLQGSQTQVSWAPGPPLSPCPTGLPKRFREPFPRAEHRIGWPQVWLPCLSLPPWLPSSRGWGLLFAKEASGPGLVEPRRTRSPQTLPACLARSCPLAGLRPCPPSPRRRATEGQGRCSFSP